MQTNLSIATKFKILSATLLIGATVSESVFAQHRHFRHGPRVGVYIGAPLLAHSFYRPHFSPFYSPYYYRPSYYAPAYYPPVVIAPVAPTTYIEQPQTQYFQPQFPQLYEAPVQQVPQTQPEPAQAGPQSGNMWFYCTEARAYYPYVKSCPAGWQQVTPQPQS